MLSCEVPLEVAIERIERRQREGTDPSDADAAVAAAQSDSFEAWPEACRVSTNGSLAESLDVAHRAMWSLR
jgi:predicted kinase